jgi:hypothetical protein
MKTSIRESGFCTQKKEYPAAELIPEAVREFSRQLSGATEKTKNIELKQPPYSLAEAEIICREYQFLVGKQFGPDHDILVNCVVVAPFDQLNKGRFIVYYLLFDDPVAALSQDYRGLLHDVMIIASGGTHELQHESLHTWLQKSRVLPCYNTQVLAFKPTSVLSKHS